MVHSDLICERVVRMHGCVGVMLLISLFLPCKARAGTCEDLAKLQIPNTSIDKAEVVTHNSFLQVLNHQPIGELPVFCRVVATLRPSSDSNIGVEMWLPQSKWNGRLLGTGSGGFGGFIFYEELAAGLRKGYAVINTDMGLTVPPGKDQAVFANRQQRWIDWGYRATHVMTLFAKRMVNAYYGHDAEHSYFLGCSTGGGQALAEAQRYPKDYDGLVGGAPPNNRTGVHLSILWNFIAMHRTAEAYIPQSKALMIEKSVIALCEGRDGTKDGIIVDPRSCPFDPATLRCSGSDSENCLTAEQVKTARLLYGGPHNPKTDEPLYPGVEPGSEEDWDANFGPAGADVQPPFAPMFEWVFGTHWNWRRFDFDRQAREFIRELGPSVNSLDPDLDKLRESGHKLLIYQGWEDPLVVPEASVDYWNAVADRAQKESRRAHNSAGTIDDYYRLFMVPGMYHCGGGPGADSFDPLSAMVEWVEDGKAPDQIIATKYDKLGHPIFQRPLCPYPQTAQYRGSGDMNKAASFTCTSPPLQRVEP
jgi:Tannase and feruloyl esterase